jgi:uncharacterized C2H2 Zn-finger protein
MFKKTSRKAKMECHIMSEPETAQDMQPRDQEPMEQGGVQPPTNESPPNPVVPLVQGITITTRKGGEAGKYVCPTCGKSFNSKAELDMHTESQHKQTQEKPQKKKTTRSRQQKSQSRKKTTKTAE